MTDALQMEDHTTGNPSSKLACHLAPTFWDLICKLEMHLAIFFDIACHVRVQLSLRLPHIFRGE
jgi:hypothetical protein